MLIGHVKYILTPKDTDINARYENESSVLDLTVLQQDTSQVNYQKKKVLIYSYLIPKIGFRCHCRLIGAKRYYSFLFVLFLSGMNLLMRL